jgi:hypothetical protein
LSSSKRRLGDTDRVVADWRFGAGRVPDGGGGRLAQRYSWLSTRSMICADGVPSLAGAFSDEDHTSLRRTLRKESACDGVSKSMSSVTLRSSPTALKMR